MGYVILRPVCGYLVRNVKDGCLLPRPLESAVESQCYGASRSPRKLPVAIVCSRPSWRQQRHSFEI